VVRRGRIYYFRFRVPRDLICRTCRRELSRSLGTSDPSVARRRAAVVATAIPHLWMSLRNAMNQEEIDAIVQSWLRAKLDEDRAHRMNSDEMKDYAERHNMTPSAPSPISWDRTPRASWTDGAGPSRTTTGGRQPPT